jgi:galactokinase
VSALTPAWSDADGAARARALFAEAFGAEPAGVWAAPGRVNLIGEHTDYNDGLCLPLALPHRTFVALRARPDAAARMVSAQEEGGGGEPRTVDLDGVGPAGGAGAVAGWPAYVAGVAWALRGEHRAVPGFDVAVDSCVPYGAGLSSSAAIESAVAVALDDVAALGLGGDDAGRVRLAAACVRAENEIAGAPTGGMDQAASLRCREGHALLLDTSDGSVEHVPFDLGAAGLALLVVDTRAEHSLVDGQYARRRTVCEESAAALGVGSLREVADAVAAGSTTLEAVLARLDDDEQRRRVRHVVTEIGRVRALVDVLGRAPGAALTGAALAEAGALLDASHASLAADYEVSCAELDVAVETARSAGAHGARMTGGGFGGSAIALVDADRADAVADAVERAFADAGFAPPAFLVATPSAAAGRVHG